MIRFECILRLRLFSDFTNLSYLMSARALIESIAYIAATQEN